MLVNCVPIEAIAFCSVAYQLAQVLLHIGESDIPLVSCNSHNTAISRAVSGSVDLSAVLCFINHGYFVLLVLEVLVV